MPVAASRQLDQHGRPYDSGSSLSSKSLQPPLLDSGSSLSRKSPQPPANRRSSTLAHLASQPYTPQRNTAVPGGGSRLTAPVVTPALHSHPGILSSNAGGPVRVRGAERESSDSSECPSSNPRWGSVCAEDSGSTLDDMCIMRRHSVSARPSELKSLLELTHNREQQLQQQTQALQVDKSPDSCKQGSL